jgi:hypothetical protein
MSDELERGLRAMLRERAAGVDDELAVPLDLDGRVRRHRTRRRVAVGGTIAAVVLAATGAAAMVIDREGPDNSVQVQPPPPPAVPVPTTRPAPTTTSQPTTRPRVYTTTRLVATTNHNAVALVNQNGTIDREVLRLPADQTIVGLDLAGDTLWYTVMAASETLACASLHRVSLTGGAPETVVDRTYAFAVSSDGSRLAYGSAPDCGHDPTDRQARLVVRELATGRTHELVDTRWSAEKTLDSAGIPIPDPTAIGWSPDGTRLAVGWTGPDRDPHFSLAVLDATARGVVPAGIATWTGGAFAFVGDDLWYTEQPGNGNPERLARRDLRTGEVVSQPSPFGSGLSQLEPGPGGSLYGATGALEGAVMQLERWDLVQQSAVVMGAGQGTPLHPSYIATG